MWLWLAFPSPGLQYRCQGLSAPFPIQMGKWRVGSDVADSTKQEAKIAYWVPCIGPIRKIGGSKLEEFLLIWIRRRHMRVFFPRRAPIGPTLDWLGWLYSGFCWVLGAFHLAYTTALAPGSPLLGEKKNKSPAQVKATLLSETDPCLAAKSTLFFANVPTGTSAKK